MRDGKSNSPRPEAQSTPLDSTAKRALVQAALERFLTSRATDADLDVFRNRDLMNAGSAEQARQFIRGTQGRSVPFDIYALWANLLCERWGQSQSGKRSASRWSRELVKVPAISSEEEGKR